MLGNESPVEKTSLDQLQWSQEQDAREWLLILWRRKWLILLLLAGVFIPALLYTSSTTPLYTAQTQLLFESNQSGNGFELGVGGEHIDISDELSIASEMQVVLSRGLASRVVGELGLEEDPEFNPDLRVASALQEFWKTVHPLAIVAAVRRWLKPEEGDVSHAASAETISGQIVVDEFRDHLSASRTPGTRVITIGLTSESAEKAAKIVNKVGELYVLSQMEDRYQNAMRVSTWLSSKVEKLRESVTAADYTVEEYRRQHGLYEGLRTPLITEQISQLSARLTEASIARRGVEAQLNEARRAEEKGLGVESTSPVLQSPLIQQLRERSVELERKQAEMEEQYGARHPLMIQLTAEKERLRREVAIEIKKIAQGLDHDYRIAVDREKSLSRDLEQVKADLSKSNEASIRLNVLSREADAKRLMLEKFMGALVQAVGVEDRRAPFGNARIISPATIPLMPTSPRIFLIFAIALTGAGLAGVALAFGIERLDRTFRSAEQLEDATKLPVIAHVPRLGREAKKRGDLSAFSLWHRGSSYAEAIRSIYTRLRLTAHKVLPQVVLFTSCEPGEGKTTIALSLARQQAQLHRKVVFVDSDFRRSMVPQRIGLSASPGLSELLNQQSTLDEAIQVDQATSLHVIAAGLAEVDHSNMVGAPHLAALFVELRARYELIIVDCAPVLSIADVNLMSTTADIVLMIVRWGKTSKRKLRFALSTMRQYGCHVSFLVLSMIDVRKQAGYSFGDSSYYYGKAARYYTDKRKVS